MSTNARPANTYRGARRAGLWGLLPPQAPQRPAATRTLDKATLRSLQRAALRRSQGRWDGRAV